MSYENKITRDLGSFLGLQDGYKLLDDVFFFQAFIGRCERLWNGQNCWPSSLLVCSLLLPTKGDWCFLPLRGISRRCLGVGEGLSAWPHDPNGLIAGFWTGVSDPDFSQMRSATHLVAGIFERKNVRRFFSMLFGGLGRRKHPDVGRLARFRPVWPAASNFLRTSDQTCDGWSCRSAPGFLLFGVRS